MSGKPRAEAASELKQGLGGTPLAYKLKTRIHPNGKLGSEDPYGRAIA